MALKSAGCGAVSRFVLCHVARVVSSTLKPRDWKFHLPHVISPHVHRLRADIPPSCDGSPASRPWGRGPIVFPSMISLESRLQIFWIRNENINQLMSPYSEYERPYGFFFYMTQRYCQYLNYSAGALLRINYVVHFSFSPHSS